jgi:hypothetical protein
MDVMPVLGRDKPSIASTCPGIQIDRNRKQLKNTLLSISSSFEPPSNENDESDSQQLKLSAQRISTEQGMQIDCSEQQP